MSDSDSVHCQLTKNRMKRTKRRCDFLKLNLNIGKRI